LEHIESLWDYPYIVKPANEGNSRGIDQGSVVHSSIDLCARATYIAREYGEAIVERYVSGGEDSREFTVAMIGSGAGSIVSPIEIIKSNKGSTVISEDDKENQRTRLKVIEDGDLKARIQQLARKVFLTSGARDYARCDIMLHDGSLYAIEMNGQPMVPDRWFKACSKEAGLNEIQYINAIALAGIVSNDKMGYTSISIPREMPRVLPSPIFERLVE
jgi:D-alanine-D-alanine ligase-like ATP-grasp enzyme